MIEAGVLQDPPVDAAVGLHMWTQLPSGTLGTSPGPLMASADEFTIEVRPDIRRATDGPTLVHGLQGFQGKVIVTPRAPHEKPRPDFLGERYRLFLKAG